MVTAHEWTLVERVHHLFPGVQNTTTFDAFVDAVVAERRKSVVRLKTAFDAREKSAGFPHGTYPAELELIAAEAFIGFAEGFRQSIRTTKTSPPGYSHEQIVRVHAEMLYSHWNALLESETPPNSRIVEP